jgi:hypothetical protein
MIPFIEPARISERQRLMHGYPDVAGRQQAPPHGGELWKYLKQIAVRPNKAPA